MLQVSATKSVATTNVLGGPVTTNTMPGSLTPILLALTPFWESYTCCNGYKLFPFSFDFSLAGCNNQKPTISLYHPYNVRNQFESINRHLIQLVFPFSSCNHQSPNSHCPIEFYTCWTWVIIFKSIWSNIHPILQNYLSVLWPTKSLPSTLGWLHDWNFYEAGQYLSG